MRCACADTLTDLSYFLNEFICFIFLSLSFFRSLIMEFGTLNFCSYKIYLSLSHSHIRSFIHAFVHSLSMWSLFASERASERKRMNRVQSLPWHHICSLSSHMLQLLLLLLSLSRCYYYSWSPSVLLCVVFLSLYDSCSHSILFHRLLIVSSFPFHSPALLWLGRSGRFHVQICQLVCQ